MTKIYNYLKQQGENLPHWLKRFKPGDPFSREEFFSSRIVFYPGAGTDGHPVKLFGSTHCAHCFVYADYGVTQTELETQLSHPNQRFKGYHTLNRLQLSQSDLTPNGWTAHIHPHEMPQNRPRFASAVESPFGFLEILERDKALDDNHGAYRLAILFIGADGIAAYDALFCQNNGDWTPFAVVLQDHGFSGNYNPFGQGGLMERIAKRCGILPPWLLVADNTKSWQGYELVPELDGDQGGMHNNVRFLYSKQ